jgi:type III secretion protein T
VDVDPTLFARGYAYFLAAGLAIARIGGLVMVAPIFTRLGPTGIIRGAIALALALPMLPFIADVLKAEHFTPITFAALTLKEGAVGVVIGLVLGVPFWAAESAGSILDYQRGSNAASLLDPLQEVVEGITGTLFGLTMVALYYTSGGLSLTLGTVYDSYKLWPPGHFLPMFGADAPSIFLSLLDRIVTMGVLLVSPLMVCLLLSDLLIGLLSRAAPNFNLFALSLSTKNLVFAALLAIYCVFMISYMGDNLGSLLQAGSELERIRGMPR